MGYHFNKDIVINNHLNQAQLTALSITLRSQMDALNQQIDAHRQGLSEVDGVPADIEQNREDAAQRSEDDEMEAALSIIDQQELRAINGALERLEGDDYGLCVNCGRPISFERLQVEPQTLRCLLCEVPHELISNN